MDLTQEFDGCKLHRGMVLDLGAGDTSRSRHHNCICTQGCYTVLRLVQHNFWAWGFDGFKLRHGPLHAHRVQRTADEMGSIKSCVLLMHANFDVGLCWAWESDPLLSQQTLNEMRNCLMKLMGASVFMGGARLWNGACIRELHRRKRVATSRPDTCMG